MKILKRTVAALATAALVVSALVFLPVKALMPAIIVLAALVQLEYGQMVSRKYPTLVWGGVLAGALYLVSTFYMSTGAPEVIVFALALAVLFSKTDKPIAALATTVFGFVYIPLMLKYFVMIPAKFGGQNMLMLLYILAIVKISDMGGFAFGMAFGKHKMCPTISPGKSWEGLAGSMFASCVISCAFIKTTGFSIPKSLAFGIAAALVGTLGDLVESRIKRECEVKESATFMPAGMGGFLDMFDSILFAPAIFYYFL